MLIPRFASRAFTATLLLIAASAQGAPPFPDPHLVEAAGAYAIWHTAVFFGAITAMVFIVVWGRVRRSRIQHETLRLLAEKGVPIPPEMFQPPATRNDLRKGLVWIALGLGMVVLGLSGQPHGAHGMGALGAIPLLIGAAFLVAWKVDRNKPQA